MFQAWYHTPLVLLVSIMGYCACASLNAASGSGGGHSRFGQFGLTPAHYQSWQEWAKKRSLGDGDAEPWSNGLFSSTNFQDWREYMNKRGFHIPDSNLGQEQFQSWVDWSKRRGLGSAEGTPFPNQNNFGRFGNFQNWGDWFVKRGAPFGQHQSVFGNAAPGAGMQSWDEFMKRQGFAGFRSGSAQSRLGHSQDGVGMQSWNEWAKRGGSGGPLTMSDGRWGSFGRSDDLTWSDKENMMDWETLYKHNVGKRQLGYTPHSFGSFHRYFTDGLQDWRSTFKGSKRAAEQSEANDNASDGVVDADKEQDQ